MLWKIVAGLIAGSFAGLLVAAFWPRIEPSAASVKAPVQQPVFVAQPVPAPAPPKPAAVAGRPIAKEAISKLANALRAPSTGGEAIASLSIPIDDGRRLSAEGLVAFAKGDIAGRAGLPEARRRSGRRRGRWWRLATPTIRRRLLASARSASRVTKPRRAIYYSRALAAGVGGARERIAALAAK